MKKPKPDPRFDLALDRLLAHGPVARKPPKVKPKKKSAIKDK
jgi:hypothetical protein